MGLLNEYTLFLIIVTTIVAAIVTKDSKSKGIAILASASFLISLLGYAVQYPGPISEHVNWLLSSLLLIGMVLLVAYVLRNIFVTKTWRPD